MTFAAGDEEGGGGEKIRRLLVRERKYPLAGRADVLYAENVTKS